MGFDPYGPGNPRSLSNDRADPRMVAPLRVCHPSVVASCRCQLSSFDTRSPDAGASPVKPLDSPRSTLPPQVNAPAEPDVLATARDDRSLPASSSPSPPGRPPLFVITCTTPPMASAPYSALCGPGTNSMRSMLPTSISARSTPPPNAFMRTPSTSTSVKSDSPPRGNIDVSAPRPPLRFTVSPGTVRSASPKLSTWRSRSCADVITVTLPITFSSGVSICAAETTIDSAMGLIASARSMARTSSAASGVGSVAPCRPGASASSR